MVGKHGAPKSVNTKSARAPRVLQARGWPSDGAGQREAPRRVVGDELFEGEVKKATTTKVGRARDFRRGVQRRRRASLTVRSSWVGAPMVTTASGLANRGSASRSRKKAWSLEEPR